MQNARHGKELENIDHSEEMENTALQTLLNSKRLDFTLHYTTLELVGVVKVQSC